jgi:hypothetical protein
MGIKDIRLTTDRQNGHYTNDLNRPLHVHFQGEDNLCHLIYLRKVTGF